MSITLRDVEEQDLENILGLNNAAGVSILPISMRRLQQLERVSRYFRLAEVNGEIAGFLVGLTPDADYDSPNFLWFQERYADGGFLYIDRVVVDDRFRRIHGESPTKDGELGECRLLPGRKPGPGFLERHFGRVLTSVPNPLPVQLFDRDRSEPGHREFDRQRIAREGADDRLDHAPVRIVDAEVRPMRLGPRFEEHRCIGG